LTFFEIFGIIYIQSERKEMINMTVKEVVNSGNAVQVMFYDGEGMCSGIMVGDKIVCACCGAVYDVDEVVSNAIEDGREAIRMFGTWVDISTEVEGDLDDYENHTVLLELEDK
jgi:hypothetical protein